MTFRLVSATRLAVPRARAFPTSPLLRAGGTSIATTVPTATCAAAALCLPSRELSSACVSPTAARLASSATTAGTGRGFGADRRGPGASSGASGAAPAGLHANLSQDGMLSVDTRRAMRDDTIIVEEVFRHIPQEGAVSVTSLYARLPPEVQEALSEKHDGLLAFLRARQQVFMVKPRPEDGKLYVAGNPIAAQRFHVRSLQKTTVRQLMGLGDGAASGGAGRSRHSGGERRESRPYRGGGGNNTRDGARDRTRYAPRSGNNNGNHRSRNSNNNGSDNAAGPSRQAPRRQQFGV